MGKLFERIAYEKLTITGAPMTIYHDQEFNPVSNDTEIAIPVKEVVKARVSWQAACAQWAYSKALRTYINIRKAGTMDGGGRVQNCGAGI